MNISGWFTFVHKINTFFYCFFNESILKKLKIYYNDTIPMVCEVNADPALCDIEELSGNNIARIYVEYIVNEIYGGGKTND